MHRTHQCPLELVASYLYQFMLTCAILVTRRIPVRYLADLNRNHAELDKRFLEKIRKKETELDRAKDDLLSKYSRLTSAFAADEKRIDSMMQALEAERKDWLAVRDK